MALMDYQQKDILQHSSWQEGIKKALVYTAVSPERRLVVVKEFDREHKRVFNYDILYAISHPNMPHLIDHNTEETVGYQVLEHKLGESSLIATSQMSDREKIETMLQLLNLAAYFHEYHLIHGDMKPRDFIIHEKTGKLIDLETVRPAGSTLRYMNKNYCAPEQIDPESQITEETDVFSLAKIIFNLILGVRENEAPLGLGHIDSLGERANTALLTKDVLSVLKRGMNFNPRNRYCNAMELREAISEAFDKITI